MVRCPRCGSEAIEEINYTNINAMNVDTLLKILMTLI